MSLQLGRWKVWRLFVSIERARGRAVIHVRGQIGGPVCTYIETQLWKTEMVHFSKFYGKYFTNH